MKILGIDIGGSALKGAPVDTQTGRLLGERHRIATPERLEPEEMARAVAKMVEHFAWKGRVGCGFPGVVQHGIVHFTGNLHPDFEDCNVDAVFSKIAKRNISLVNDADAAGMAEIKFGAGRGVKGTVLMLTFGTGVGSALFIDGVLYPNTEFGHLPMHGRSAERRVSAAAKERHDLSFKKWAHRVSDYMELLEALVWPDLIIVGGGISADHDKWFKHLKIRSKVVPAKFLNEAGIVGAALHAKNAKG